MNSTNMLNTTNSNTPRRGACRRRSRRIARWRANRFLFRDIIVRPRFVPFRPRWPGYVALSAGRAFSFRIPHSEIRIQSTLHTDGPSSRMSRL
jgi:hypothetical protein